MRIRGFVGLALGACALSACSTPAASPPAPAAVVTAAATPASSSTVTACTDGQVTLSSLGGQGAGGTFLGSAIFSLVGTTPYTLTGYAGLDVATGRTIAHASRGTQNEPPGSSPTRSVTLRPGGPADVRFSWVEAPNGPDACPRVTSLTVTALGLHRSMTIAAAAAGAGTSGLCQPPEVGFAAGS